MERLTCQGGLRYEVLLISILLHAVALAVFTGVRLSANSPEIVEKPSSVTMQMIETALERSAPVPPPKVEPVVKTEPKPERKSDSTPQPLVIEKTPVPPDPEPEPVKAVTPQPAVPMPGLQEVEFFGQKSVACRICYVVDCSGSMYGQMHRVKDKLKASILALNPQQSFCVLFFMDGRQILMSGSGHLEPATISARSQACELIDKVKPQGVTDATHGLECAMRLRDADSHGPDVIYFLTDGFDLDDSGSQLFLEKISGSRNSLAPSSVLHTIGFWPQQRDRQMLKTLAQLTGGNYVEGIMTSKEQDDTSSE